MLEVRYLVNRIADSRRFPRDTIELSREDFNLNNGKVGRLEVVVVKPHYCGIQKCFEKVGACAVRSVSGQKGSL